MVSWIMVIGKDSGSPRRPRLDGTAFSA